MLAGGACGLISWTWCASSPCLPVSPRNRMEPSPEAMLSCHRCRRCRRCCCCCCCLPRGNSAGGSAGSADLAGGSRWRQVLSVRRGKIKGAGRPVRGREGNADGEHDRHCLSLRHRCWSANGWRVCVRCCSKGEALLFPCASVAVLPKTDAFACGAADGDGPDGVRRRW